jgi:hypothetical protein
MNEQVAVLTRESNAQQAIAGSHLPLDSLQEICECGLLAGPIWRPSVVAEQEAEGWYWHDEKDDDPDEHGPFPTERDALLDAIRKFGVEDEAVLEV